MGVPFADRHRRAAGSARRAVAQLGPLLFFALATVVMTWPLGRDIRTAVPDHDDAYFHVWRMAWVAHQLPRAPLHLFDANIFVPTGDTLALSDAALLQGLLAAPPLWLGARPVVVYNVLLLGSFAASGWCAYLLAMRLTGVAGPSLLAGFVFAFAPYRLAHFGHLELQAAMWMPLALLVVHRLVTEPGGAPDAAGTTAASSIRAGVALGAVLALQAISALYYFMFLAVVLAAMVAVLLVASPWPARWRLLCGLAVAAVVLAVVLVPYSRPYARARSTVGPRGEGEVAQFSARPGDYLRGGVDRGSLNAGDAQGSLEERVLSPGLVAPALALVGIWPPLDAWRVATGVALAVAFDASLGTNGRFFPAARRLVPVLHGLRAPARFGVLVLLLLAMLAAAGLARLVPRGGSGTSRLAAGAAIALCAVDFWAAPAALRYPVTGPTALTRLLASQPPGTVVLHLPVPTTDGLWRHETTYEYLSTFHWQPLVNGYSGYAPPVYLRTLDALRTFPDEESVARLHRLGVGLVVLHPDLMGRSEYESMAAGMERRGDFERVAHLKDPQLESVVFRLVPATAPREDGR
jgi:hypothetical protein